MTHRATPGGLRTGGAVHRPCGGAGRAATGRAGWKPGSPGAPSPSAGLEAARSHGSSRAWTERRRERRLHRLWGACTQRAGRARLSRAPRSTRPRAPTTPHQPSPHEPSPHHRITDHRSDAGRRSGAGPASPASPCGLPASPAGFRGPPFLPPQRAGVCRAGFWAGLVLAFRGVCARVPTRCCVWQPRQQARGSPLGKSRGSRGVPACALVPAPEGGGSAWGRLPAQTQHVGRRARSRGAERGVRSPYGNCGGVRGLGS